MTKRQSSGEPWAEIGAEVRRLREKAGLTITEVASRMGRTVALISDYERGISMPSWSFITEVSAALAVDPGTVDRWRAIRSASPRASAGAWSEARRASHRRLFLEKTDVSRSPVTALRVSRGMTLAMLAGECKINDSRLCGIESGRLPPRSGGSWRGEAVTIATYFDTTCEELWPDHVPQGPRLPSPDPPKTPEELAIDSETIGFVLGEVAALPQRERVIVQRYFGLNGDEELLKDIGAGMGISRERARQLCARAIKRVKSKVAERFLDSNIQHPA